MEGDSTYTDETEIAPGDSYYNWTELDIGSGSYGTYTFTASSPNPNIENATVEGVLVDEAKPTVGSKSPQDRINDDSPTVQISGSDSASSVDETEITVTGDDVDQSANGTDSASIDLSGISDGTYDVSASLTDEVGNTRDVSWSFTVDTQYEGDTDPEVSPQPQVFRIDDDEPFRVNVELEGKNEPSDISVTCSYQGGELASTSFRSVPQSGTATYPCDLQPASYMNMAVDLSLKLEDEAGNEWTQDVGEYIFDFSNPEIGNLSAVVGVFNDDFEVSYEASDSGEELSVQKVHYQIDDDEYSPEVGKNVSEVDGKFSVDTEGLSKGDHTVYAWAVDEAGRLSDVSTFDFDFRPNAEPEASLSSVSELNVTAGKSESVSVNVTNTGELFIGKMDLEMNSDLGNRSRVIEGLKPGESEDALFSLGTDSRDLGVHTVNFVTQSPDSSKTVRVVVTANEEQEENISSTYEQYLEKYEELKENVTALKDQGLADFRAEKLEGNTSQFFSDMQAAQSAMNDGDLYKVESHLNGIGSDYRQASSSYEEVKQGHATAERNQLIGMVLFLFVALGGSGLAWVAFFSEEYTLDAEALVERVELLEEPVETVQTTLDQYEISLAPLENAVESVAELIAEEEEEIEEAEEQAFQGFT